MMIIGACNKSTLRPFCIITFSLWRRACSRNACGGTIISVCYSGAGIGAAIVMRPSLKREDYVLRPNCKLVFLTPPNPSIHHISLTIRISGRRGSLFPPLLQIFVSVVVMAELRPVASMLATLQNSWF